MPATQRPIQTAHIFRIALLILFASHFAPPKAVSGDVDLYFAPHGSDAPGNPVFYVEPWAQYDNLAAFEEFDHPRPDNDNGPLGISAKVGTKDNGTPYEFIAALGQVTLTNFPAARRCGTIVVTAAGVSVAREDHLFPTAPRGQERMRKPTRDRRPRSEHSKRP